MRWTSMIDGGERRNRWASEDARQHTTRRARPRTLTCSHSATQAVIRQLSLHTHKAPSNQSLEGRCDQSGGFTYDDETQHRSLQGEFAMAKALPRAERVPAVIYVIVDQQTIACIVLHIVDELSLHQVFNALGWSAD